MPEPVTSDLRANNRTVVYRLVKERFSQTPLSSEGARRYDGRWNPPGVGILYTSASPELALLEQLVHLPSLPYQDLPQLFLVTLALPSAARPVENLSPHWRDAVNYQANYLLLEDWLRNPDVLALQVPSAVVVESPNFLLHPFHPDFSKIEIVSTHPFNIDRRLRTT